MNCRMSDFDKNYLRTILKSICAGVCIGFACLTYILINNKILGALAFSLGLFIIVTRNFSLFTGRLCFLGEKKMTEDIFELLNIWIGNFLGMALFVLLISITRLGEHVMIIATEILLTKTNDSYLSLFVLGFFCEVMIYISVTPFKDNSKSDIIRIISLVIGVFVFVLCGFEHCVANMFYFLSARAEMGTGALMLLTTTAGNIFGGLSLNCLQRLSGNLQG